MLQEVELKPVKRMNHDEYPVLLPNFIENVHKGIIDLLFHNNDKSVRRLKHLLQKEEVVNHIVKILSAKRFG